MKSIEVRGIWSSEKSTEEIERYESLGIAMDDEPEEEFDDLSLIVEHIIAFHPTANKDRTRVYVVTAGDFLIDMPYEKFKELYLEAK